MDIAQQIQAMQRKVNNQNNESSALSQKNASSEMSTPSKLERVTVNYSNNNFDASLSSLNDLLLNNKDLVLFTYLLEIKNYTSKTPEENLKKVREDIVSKNHFIDISVSFCNDSGSNFLNSKRKNLSCLEQIYAADLFNNEVAFVTLSKTNPSESVRDTCENCLATTLYKGGTIPFCPYKLCALIKLVAKQSSKTTKEIYEQILDRDLDGFLPDYNRKSINVSDELLNDIDGVNSKSARSAMLLQQMGLFNVTTNSESTVEFSYVDLCTDNKKTRIDDILNFWEDRQGNVGRIIPLLKDDAINTKENCKKCSYEQCPHKVGAYLHFIAKKHSCDVYSLMRYVADENTIAKISPDENYQFDKYVSNINTIPITESSKKQYIEIIKYIVNHKKDSVVPFLPFNMILHTADDKMAEDVFNDFSNAIWYFDYLCSKPNFDAKKISIANTSFEKLIEEYENTEKCMLFHIENIELLANSDEFLFNNLMPKWTKLLEEKKDKIITFISGDKYKLQSFFAKTPILYNRIFSYHLFVGDMSEETVFKKIYERLSEKYNMDKDFEDSLWECIAEHYSNSELKSNDYIDNLYETIIFNHYSKDINATNILNTNDLPLVRKKRTEAEIFKDINEMIGLQSIKEELKKINALAKYNQKTRRNGSSTPNYHMVFSGSAGTGKTTVAKLLSEILYVIGAIKQNKLIVCSAKDLIGEYMGQTSPKVAKMCERAYNGILFIDEAYQLNPYTTSNASSYKEEAIAELIQQMENNRDRLVVIFAGYTKEMEDFIERSNSGMKSRIGNIIDFPDYTKDELLEIFKLIANKESLLVTDEAIDRVSKIIEEKMKSVENFGNARFVRHLFERSLMKHAFRTCDLEDGSIEIKTLDVCDIDEDVAN